MNFPATPVQIPLLNPNEPDARIASLDIREGQSVHIGDLLCTLETTKSTAEILAETDGFIAGLEAKTGQIVRAGDILCYIAVTEEWRPEIVKAQAPERSIPMEESTHPEDMRITQPALIFAKEAGVDLSQLPAGPLVTEKMIRDLIEQGTVTGEPPGTFDPSAIIVYGGGGHGKSVIDLIRSLNRYDIRGVVDDGIAPGESILGVRVVGGSGALNTLTQNGVRQAVNAVGGIGDLQSRLRVFEYLRDAGFNCPAVVHPSAVVEPSAVISEGVQVFPNAYVGSEAHLGFGVIVNTGAIVSHDCRVNDYANLSPGAILAGGVRVCEAVLIGMGATINLGVQIGNGARIGNGATVKADVPADGIVRAGGIWPE